MLFTPSLDSSFAQLLPHWFKMWGKFDAFVAIVRGIQHFFIRDTFQSFNQSNQFRRDVIIFHRFYHTQFFFFFLILHFLCRDGFMKIDFVCGKYKLYSNWQKTSLKTPIWMHATGNIQHCFWHGYYKWAIYSTHRNSQWWMTNALVLLNISSHCMCMKIEFENTRYFTCQYVGVISLLWMKCWLILFLFEISSSPLASLLTLSLLKFVCVFFSLVFLNIDF